MQSWLDRVARGNLHVHVQALRNSNRFICLYLEKTE